MLKDFNGQCKTLSFISNKKHGFYDSLYDGVYFLTEYFDNCLKIRHSSKKEKALESLNSQSLFLIIW
jgi:hypothetical protein